MFVQKKTGFWLYTGVQFGFLMLIISIYPLSNIFTFMTLILMTMIILVFEILYALNLKHMKN